MSELGDRLRELQLPESGLAKAEASRAAVERLASTRGERGGRRWLRRTVVVPVIAVTVIALAFTPPGRAVTREIGGLVGIGEVGGPPTHPSEVGDFDPATDQIVLAIGETADGVPFEIVAFRSDESIADRKDSTICVNAEFPDGPSGSGGTCYAGALRYGPLCCTQLILGDPASSIPRVEGAIRPGVKRVEITYRDTEGSDRVVEAVTGMITREFAERLNVKYPSGLFVASLPGLDEQTDLPKPLQAPAKPISVSAYDDESSEPLETETIGPVSASRIRQMDEVDRIRLGMKRFQAECQEGVAGEATRIDQLSPLCQQLLDSLSR